MRSARCWELQNHEIVSACSLVLPNITVTLLSTVGARGTVCTPEFHSAIAFWPFLLLSVSQVHLLLSTSVTTSLVVTTTFSSLSYCCGFLAGLSCSGVAAFKSNLYSGARVLSAKGNQAHSILTLSELSLSFPTIAISFQLLKFFILFSHLEISSHLE